MGFGPKSIPGKLDLSANRSLGGILRPNAPKLKEEGVAPGGQPRVNELNGCGGQI